MSPHALLPRVAAWNTLLTLTIVAASLLLGGAGIVGVYTLRLQAEADRWVTHTWQVLETLQRVASRLLELENRQRGYLLTRDATYLAGYDPAQAALWLDIDALAQLTRDNARQAERIAPLRRTVDERVDLLARTVSHVQEGRPEEANRLLATGAGRRMMEKIQSLLNAMRSEEETLLRLRVRRAGRAARASVVAMAGVGALAVAMFVVTRTVILVSERRREQDAQRLAESAHRLSLALAAGEMGMWDWDVERNRSVWSPEQFRLLGLPPSLDGRVETERFFELLLPEDRPALEADLRRALDAGADFAHEFRVLRDGEVRWIAGRGRAVNQSGERHMLGLNWDVTERKANEEALHRLNAELERRVQERTTALSEANTELQAFAHSVAHDLRAPLRNVQGYASALLEDEAERLTAEGRLYAERLAQAAVRMDRLITDLLAWSRLSRNEIVPARVDLDAAVASVRRDLAADIQRRGARVDVAGPLPPVLAHRASLVQVLANLVVNAITFVAPGVAPQVRIGAQRRGEAVRLEVADNGLGIEPRHHERIFQVFERLHGQERYPGTGIGLAIVRKGVERMGGRAGVDSTPGEGSTFWIELPRAPT